MLGSKGLAQHGKQGQGSASELADLLIDLAGPILVSLGFSGCIGAVAGVALKRIGQTLIFILGMAVLLIQGLAHMGFITVHWSHVHDTVVPALDMDKDGKVDHNDFKPLISQGLAGLSQGVPSVGGFLAGFVMAMRYL